MYYKTKMILMSAAIAAGTLVVGSAASAATIGTYTESGACLNTDLTATADDCFGAVLPTPANDSNIDLNQSTFGGITGLFGITTWNEIAKQDIGGSTTGSIGLQVVSNGGTGSWTVNTGSLALQNAVMIVLKASNSFSTYLYNPGSNAGDGGSWNTAAIVTNGGQTPNLSHFAIYSSGTVTTCPPGTSGTFPNCGSTSVVPVPAGLPLMLTVIGVGAYMRKRARKSA